jgi:hypothetical protein
VRLIFPAAITVGPLLGRFFVPLTPFCRRSDADLLRSAIDTLQAMTEVPADYVEIKVASGWISLSGMVDWPWQRQAVVNACAVWSAWRGWRRDRGSG